MSVTMWLKTVRTKVRRHAVTMGVEWRDGHLYHEVASHLDGEAKRWFATWMESVSPVEESINMLFEMLRAKYMTQRTGPEVVDRLSARSQIKGDRLVEYAQALREIGENGDVGEDWLVRAFLKGISSSEGATHVRGHRRRTLDEAVSLAIPQVGDYGEGYGVGLETAMAHWDEREAQQGHGSLTAAAGSGEQDQLGLDGESRSVVTGYGPMWGAPHKRPQYDTKDRQLSAGEASGTNIEKHHNSGKKTTKTCELLGLCFSTLNCVSAP
ncbi:Retrotransposon gag protein [Phytophthora infestans]|uniref:Retrotransposon gag protein n=1 Tax=Phytophthora infestans TaxID=4787 RepID=A0A833SI29_PHYIN|nr:Retrotransposon gag protein [Phytophthora infestans]